MDKRDRSFINMLKTKTDGHFYINLVKHIETRMAELDSMWAGNGSVDEFRKLQGRKLELQEMLKQLTSKPIVNEYSGGYGS